jgi:hypothetical protein
MRFVAFSCIVVASQDAGPHTRSSGDLLLGSGLCVQASKRSDGPFPKASR